MGTSNMELNDDSATQSDEATKTDADSDTEKTETDDDQSPPSPGSIPYEENERVLAFHNLHVYEAKVIFSFPFPFIPILLKWRKE